jgi:S-formylglutathione hydrolase FrmB
MNVIIPQPSATLIGMDSAARVRKDYRVLYLLHGCSDDHTIWGRRTSIERYVAGQELVVIMPSVQRSFYTDMVHGGRYWTFISEELPRIAEAMFPISTRREDTFVAGLSMGGFGTLKLVLNCPERYAGGAALSSVVDLNWHREALSSEWEHVFGSMELVRDSANDLYAAAAKLAASDAPRPKIFQCCGTGDRFCQDNARFQDHLRALKLESVYREYPGEHNWAFWDAHIVEGLESIGAIVR